MLDHVVTKDEFMTAFDKHSDMLLRFLADFTPDEIKARKILEEAIWDWLCTPETPNAKRFTQLMTITRAKAIEMLNDTVCNPYIERKFFQFSDSVTIDEKEIFFLLYFRGFTRERVAFAYHITLEQVKATLRKVLCDLNTQLG